MRNIQHAASQHDPRTDAGFGSRIGTDRDLSQQPPTIHLDREQRHATAVGFGIEASTDSGQNFGHQWRAIGGDGQLLGFGRSDVGFSGRDRDANVRRIRCHRDVGPAVTGAGIAIASVRTVPAPNVAVAAGTVAAGTVAAGTGRSNRVILARKRNDSYHRGNGAPYQQEQYRASLHQGSAWTNDTADTSN